jgi:hypothetical protein
MKVQAIDQRELFLVLPKKLLLDLALALKAEIETRRAPATKRNPVL